MRCRRRKKYLNEALVHESKQAFEAATEVLENTKARTKEVKEVAHALRILRERNHFAEQLQPIMEGFKR